MSCFCSYSCAYSEVLLSLPLFWQNRVCRCVFISMFFISLLVNGTWRLDSTQLNSTHIYTTIYIRWDEQNRTEQMKDTLTILIHVMEISSQCVIINFYLAKYNAQWISHHFLLPSHHNRVIYICAYYKIYKGLLINKNENDPPPLFTGLYIVAKKEILLILVSITHFATYVLLVMYYIRRSVLRTA